MRILCFAIAWPIAALAQQSVQFGTFTACSVCHSNLDVPSGVTDFVNGIPDLRARAQSVPQRVAAGPGALWPASMMAHSSRDPYWRAKVRFESAANPSFGAVVEDTCLRCHAPVQQYLLRGSETPMRLDHLNPNGQEGVNCTVCHQVTTEGLGSASSFEGGFTIGPDRRIFGPHANPFAQPMVASSGFTPAFGDHVRESALCATCHTVITPILTAEGVAAGEFLEQSPYLEWLASDAAVRGQSCQSCHMPVFKDTSGVEATQHIAHRPNVAAAFPQTSPRKPFGLHSLVGGNYQMSGMLAELIPVEAALLDAQRGRVRENLRGAARLHSTARRDGSALSVAVTVANLTGHKLPTGFPSRRIWLNFTVLNHGGETVFESGRWDTRNIRIAGGNASEPHHTRITSQEQTMIYETEMEDVAGDVTSSILRAARFRKDNRILPAGFDVSRVRIDGIHASNLLPAGTAGDLDFLPGSDTVEYVFAAPEGNGPYRIRVELLYQMTHSGHLAGMDRDRSADEQVFLDLFERHAAPVPMARREFLVE
ncbi:MAG: hypothetical protein IPM24_09240 [Bryobacterales bacterium]|nr:hypothetical protein [Bryobacterales bacterium]